MPYLQKNSSKNHLRHDSSHQEIGDIVFPYKAFIKNGFQYLNKMDQIVENQRKIVEANKKLVESIKAGVFQNRIEYDNNIANVKDMDCDSMKAVDETCSLIESLSHTIPDTSSFLVYRALHNLQIENNYLPHPIPFSTTRSLSFAKDWLPENGGYILKIKLKGIPFLAICQNIEQEIVLPPGVIYIENRYYDGKNIILNCYFKQSNKISSE